MGQLELMWEEEVAVVEVAVWNTAELEVRVGRAGGPGVKMRSHEREPYCPQFQF